MQLAQIDDDISKHHEKPNAKMVGYSHLTFRLEPTL